MKLRPFELALLIIFGVSGVIGLIVLSAYDPPPDEDDVEQVVISEPVEIWGLLDEEIVKPVLDELRTQFDAFAQVEYVEKDPRTFDFDLINAIAERTNPDLVLLSHEKLAEHRKKLYPISYDTIPLRDYLNRYIDGASIYTLSDGVYGLPVMVDPLMMYWNRDMFANKGYINPPRNWEQVVSETVPDLIERNFKRDILKSPIAFGTYNNVRNAYGIISMLALQGGSKMVTEQADGKYSIELNKSQSGGNTSPLTDALTFYTRFGSISNPLYSWNRTLPNDRQMFTAQDLAMYFGYGSEAKEIEELNPNLLFDIEEVPVGEGAARRTYGKLYAVSILREANSLNDAFVIASALGSEVVSAQLAEQANMAPVYRTLLAAGSNGIYERSIYQAAQVARSWLNPDKETLEERLSDGLDDIHANRQSPDGVAGDLNQQVQLLFNR